MTIIEISDSTSVGDSKVQLSNKGKIQDYDRYLGLYEKVVYMEPKFREVDGKLDDLKNLVLGFKRDVFNEVVERVISYFQKGMLENKGNTNGFHFKFDANCTPNMMESEMQLNNPRHGKKRRSNPFSDEVRT